MNQAAFFVSYDIKIGNDVYPFPKVELVRTAIGTLGISVGTVQNLM